MQEVTNKEARITMRRSFIYFAVCAAALVLSVLLLISSRSVTGQENDRAACQKTCTTEYQQCLSTAGDDKAKRTACKETFNTCKANCRDVRPNAKPTPTPTPESTPTPTPTE